MSHDRRSLARIAAATGGVLALVGCSVDLGNNRDPGTAEFDQTLGFSLTELRFDADSAEPAGCPMLSAGATDVFLATLPPGEAARLSQMENARELFVKMSQTWGFKSSFQLQRSPQPGAQRGDGGPSALVKAAAAKGPQALEALKRQIGIPAGKGRVHTSGNTLAYDSCTDPDDFPQLDKGHQPYAGRVAGGMNLDGRISPDDYVGPDGRRGVDNQMWRVVGCVKGWRAGGDVTSAAPSFLSGSVTTLIRLTDVDDRQNDDDVGVAIYSSDDPVTVDGRGGVLAKATFNATEDPRYQNRTRGKIRNGVLTTEPFTLRIKFTEQIVDDVKLIHGARVVGSIRPNGTLSGGIYGYYDAASFLNRLFEMTQGASNTQRYTCPAMKTALYRYADGIPDRRTGRNTALSSAMLFDAVPAYVIPPSNEAQGTGSWVTLRPFKRWWGGIRG